MMTHKEESKHRTEPKQSWKEPASIIRALRSCIYLGFSNAIICRENVTHNVNLLKRWRFAL